MVEQCTTSGIPGLDSSDLRGRDDSDLTPRQRQVLQLIAEGHSTKEIARKLNIS